MTVLVTGHKSGMGRYIFENIGGEVRGWDRDIAEAEKYNIQQEGVDIVVHCAFNSAQEITSEELAEYIQDNILFTEELSNIPHKRFLFFSSVDVYPRDAELHKEDVVINVGKVEGLYAITKLMSESIIQKNCPRYVILRNAAFLGMYSRKNSLRKILEDNAKEVSLAGDSEFNYVVYKDVLSFVKAAIEQDLQGIYNVASAENIQLSRVAELYGKKVVFGGYRYKVGNVDNAKAANIIPAFAKSSQEIIKEFITL